MRVPWNKSYFNFDQQASNFLSKRKYQNRTYVPPIKHRNMSDRRHDSCKIKAVWNRHEDGQVNLALFLIGRQIELKFIIHNSRHIICLSSIIEQMGRKHRKSFRPVDVESPVGDGDQDVDDGDVADEDVDNGEEGRDERTVKEGRNDWPIEGEGSNPQPFHARPDLLGGYGFGKENAE